MASILRFDNWQNSDGTSIATTDASGNISFAGALGATAGLGKILQVVQQTRSTATSTTANTWVSTGLTATITPTSATSTILVISHLPCRGNSTTCGHTVYRGDIATGTELTGVSNGFGDFDSGRAVNTGLIVDSPATTSATTYTQAFISPNADAFLSSIRLGSLTLREISA